MINRRAFLKTSVCAAGAAAVIPSTLVGQDKKSVVAVATGSASDCVRKSIDALGGIKQFVKQGDRVVIKPNIGFPNPPEWGTTTHPDVVKAVVEVCREAGAQRIIIVDHPLRDSQICRERTGIESAIKNMKGVVFAMLDDEKFYQETPIPNGKELKTTAIMKEVLRANCLINVPTAKSHSACGVSLGIKNLMGLVWDRGVFHEKLELNRAIAEQLYVIKPTLTIVNCMYALITNGPSGPGKTVELKKVVASTDPVAADSYTVSLARWYNREFNGSQVKHLKIANELGFGEVDVAKMDVKSV
ncbi:MAG: DUF362 domain-containing protein [Chitinivibrionales bacterium]|nr:DUF362 domain-containing protein [Chitinivibrionales bacterium]